jgi:hypothetical protein
VYCEHCGEIRGATVRPKPVAARTARTRKTESVAEEPVDPEAEAEAVLAREMIARGHAWTNGKTEVPADIEAAVADIMGDESSRTVEVEPAGDDTLGRGASF